MGRPVGVGLLFKGDLTKGEAPRGYGHWVVVIGYTKEFYFLHDPNGTPDFDRGLHVAPTGGESVKVARATLDNRWMVEGYGSDVVLGERAALVGGLLIMFNCFIQALYPSTLSKRLSKHFIQSFFIQALYQGTPKAFTKVLRHRNKTRYYDDISLKQHAITQLCTSYL